MISKRIQKAIDIFLDAINNGTLAKGTCVACAVGNLVAHGMGAKIVWEDGQFKTTKHNYLWGDVILPGGLCMNLAAQIEVSRLGNMEDLIKEELQNVDFTLDELMSIERAFEANTRIDNTHYTYSPKDQIRADQIRGLEAVIKVMMTFEEEPQTFSIQKEFTDKVIPELCHNYQ